jgi:two-component system, chemotaxis family, chemotaxis protein CheY
MKKILLVDDDSLNAKLLKAMIKKVGDFEVTNVETAPEAVFHYCNGNFDIVFLDIMMPILDGETVLQSLEQLSKKGLIPRVCNVVVCTSLGDVERLNRLASYPQVSGFLRKPVALTQLAVEISKICDLTQES